MSWWEQWLFPRDIHGYHLATENMRSQLVARSIHRPKARNAALFELAAEISNPVFAESAVPRTAPSSRAALAARDWCRHAYAMLPAQMTASRRDAAEGERMLTLVGRTATSDCAEDPPLLGEYELRPCFVDDIPRLGRLYFHAYDPGLACATLDEAVADIEASFAGEYGPLWAEGSLAAWSPSGEVVAAVFVVTEAPWDDTPDCPFIIELFTARTHRRRGLGRRLVTWTMGVAARHGYDCIALRVATTNVGARALYAELGFHEWQPA